MSDITSDAEAMRLESQVADKKFLRALIKHSGNEVDAAGRTYREIVDLEEKYSEYVNLIEKTAAIAQEVLGKLDAVKKLHDRLRVEYTATIHDYFEPNMQIQDIARLVGLKHNVSVKAMQSQCRETEITNARYEAWYLARTISHLSYSEIARFFKKDHSSIIKGVQKYAKKIGMPLE